MPFLLMIFLSVVCLFQGYPRPPWGGSPWLSAALTALAVALLAGHALVVSRRVSRPLAREPALRDRLLPVLLLIIQRELERAFPANDRRWQLALNLAGTLAMLAVLVGMPWLVRLVLGLKPLPAGPVRDRLLAASGRLRFRCSDVLLWN